MNEEDFAPATQEIIEDLCSLASLYEVSYATFTFLHEDKLYKITLSVKE